MSAEKTFNEKVVTVQSQLKAPKGQYNNFGKYNYRSLEDISEALKPLLANEGLRLTLSDEPVEIASRIYIKATAHLTDGVSKLEVTGFAREAETKKGMDESQITGTASSYARKYALNGMFLIDDTKDADTNEHDEQQKQSNPSKNSNSNGKANNNQPTQQSGLITGRQLAELNNEARKIAGVSNIDPSVFTTKVAEMGNVASVEFLPEKFYQEALATMIKWKQSYTKVQQGNANQNNNKSIPWGQKQ
ncbi:hypothetical protein A5881_002939 [Enterococcus termitis]|nr:hypothetical protein A5881_002406 [Enterococcus termitis]